MIIATGKCMGILVEEFKNKETGEIRTSKKMGIGFKKERGFDDELFVWTMSLDKEVTTAELHKIESFKGKMVAAGCIANEYQMNGKKGISYRWNGEIREVGSAAPVAQTPPLAKVG